MEKTTDEITKRCSGCERYLCLSSFGKNIDNEDGHTGCCRECRKIHRKQPNILKKSAEQMAKWRRNNPNESALIKHRNYENNPDTHKENDRIKRAKRFPDVVIVPFSESVWQDRIKEFNYSCAYCLRHESECGPMTMDHMKSLKMGGEHSIENVVPSCSSCNTSKVNKDHIEFENYRVQVGNFLAKKKYRKDIKALAYQLLEHCNKNNGYNDSQLGSVLSEMKSQLQHQGYHFDIPNETRSLLELDFSKGIVAWKTT